MADFNHQDSKIDSETGKKKPVYRWNFEELTKDIYQQHLDGKLSIGIQPCTEESEVKFGVIDIDPKDYADFNKKDYIDIITSQVNKLFLTLWKTKTFHPVVDL